MDNKKLDALYKALYTDFDNLHDNKKYPKLYEAALDIIVELLTQGQEPTEAMYEKASKMVESKAKEVWALLFLCHKALYGERSEK